MLAKAVCMKCKCKNSLVGWSISSEGYWNDGSVCCPAVFDAEKRQNVFTRSVQVKEPPPNKCPYTLEHALAKGTENAE